MSALLDTAIFGIVFLVGTWIQAQESTLVFRAVNGSKTGMFSIFLGQGRYGDPNNLSNHFKSEIIDQWEDVNITEVNISVKVGSTEKSYFHFDGRGTNRTSWFSSANLMKSFPDTNLKGEFDAVPDTQRGKMFDIAGIVRRRFYISKKHSGCSNDLGWFMVLDVHRTAPCLFDASDANDTVIIMYSTLTRSANWFSLYMSDIGRADLLEIYVDAKLTATTTTASTPGTSASPSDITTADAIATTSGSNLMCGNCTCKSHVINMTSEELHEVIVQLKKELQVDKRTTSQSIRKKISASDSRGSAQTIGTFGAVMLSFPFIFIILSDLITLFQFYNNATEKRPNWDCS